ncbi:putative chitinase 1 [Lamellibrachia satsuma]|nr:putative chitinase 1 [Lamellibrachia satsuma]
MELVKTKLFVSLVAALFLIVKGGSDEYSKRICYYYLRPSYSLVDQAFTVENINAEVCTHIVYAFVTVQNSGSGPLLWHFGDDSNGVLRVSAKIDRLKKSNPLVKVMIALIRSRKQEAWIAKMLSSNEMRLAFVKQSVTFLRQHGLDGIDVDFDYAGGQDAEPQLMQRLILLLGELSAAFEDDAIQSGNDRLLLTSFVSMSDSTIANPEIPAMVRYLDWVGILPQEVREWDSVIRLWSPDRDTSQRTMKWAAKFMVSEGCPKEKIVIGVCVDSIVYTRTPVTYNKICQLVVQDSKKSPEELYSDATIRLIEDTGRLGMTEAWLKNQKLAGFLFWRSDLDESNSSFCLKGKFPTLGVVAVKGMGDTKERVRLTTTTPELIQFTCPSAVGYYQDPNDCSKYLYCRQGKKFEHHCERGHIFHPDLRLCYPVSALHNRELDGSIRKQELLVRDYIDEHELDVVAITETWLVEGEMTVTSELCGGDFTFVHRPRSGARRGGGVGVLFRKTLQLVSRADIDTHACETCCVFLRNIRIGCITRVIVVYRPPTSNFRTFLDDVGKILLIAAAHPTESVICGDFNTRYGDSTCADAMKLDMVLYNMYKVQHTSAATPWTWLSRLEHLTS